jgi:hypothetical protein
MNPFLLRNVAQIWPIVVLNSLANTSTNQKKYITFVALKIKLKCCLGSFVLRSPFATHIFRRRGLVTGLVIGYVSGYGAVLGIKYAESSVPDPFWYQALSHVEQQTKWAPPCEQGQGNPRVGTRRSICFVQLNAHSTKEQAACGYPKQDQQNWRRPSIALTGRSRDSRAVPLPSPWPRPPVGDTAFMPCLTRDWGVAES